ncbi:MAG: ABC transporter permease subunit [Synergistaceae bacterium]|nr:ABC transporter permease subunit [Synergistaceae bacterium]
MGSEKTKNLHAARCPLALRGCAVCVAAILGTVTAFILYSGIEALTQSSRLALFGSVWSPASGKFGILTMIQASILLALSALALGWLLSLGLCCLMNGLAPKVIAKVIMLIINMMAAIPTVVYGFAAVFLLVPVIRDALGGTGFCWLTAGVILALQGVPAMTIIMNGAMSQISHESKLTSQALGFTNVQHLTHVVLPLSGKAMISAAIIGFGRAVGDALLPTMLAGNAIRFAHSPLDSMRTLTAHISLVLSSDIGGGEHLSLLLAGALLLTFCAIVSLAARHLIRGKDS